MENRLCLCRLRFGTPGLVCAGGATACRQQSCDAHGVGLAGAISRAINYNRSPAAGNESFVPRSALTAFLAQRAADSVNTFHSVHTCSQASPRLGFDATAVEDLEPSG